MVDNIPESVDKIAESTAKGAELTMGNPAGKVISSREEEIDASKEVAYAQNQRSFTSEVRSGVG